MRDISDVLKPEAAKHNQYLERMATIVNSPSPKVWFLPIYRSAMNFDTQVIENLENLSDTSNLNVNK